MNKNPSNDNPSFRDDATDPLRSNSFKTYKTSEYQSKIMELSNQLKALRDQLISLEKAKQQPKQQRTSQNSQEKQVILKKVQQRCQQLQHNQNQMEKQIERVKAQNYIVKKQNKHLKEVISSLEWSLKNSKPKEDENKGKEQQLRLGSIRSMEDLRAVDNRSSQGQPNYCLTAKDSLNSNKTSATNHLIRELLVECNESSEFGHNFKKIDIKKHTKEKDQFYQYKNTEDCFEPFYSNLNREMKIRLRKSLLKEKEVLFVDSCIQVGTICQFKPPLDDPLAISILVVVTNISIFPLENLTIEYVYSKDVTVSKRNHTSTKHSRLSQGDLHSSQIHHMPSNQQVKDELLIVVNNIDFQCIKATITYHSKKAEQPTQLILILPVSKFKLFRTLPYSTNDCIEIIQKLIQMDHNITRFDKLKAYFPHLYEGKDKYGKPFYSIKIIFLTKIFYLELAQLESRLKISVHHSGDRALAQKIIGQMEFLLKK